MLGDAVMELKNKISLVGVDLDGTLLRNDKTISEETKKAVKSAFERGITVVPVTGRPLCGIPQFILDMPEIRYVISTNGARITDIKADKTVYESPLSKEKTAQLIEYATDCGYDFEAFAEGIGYIEPALMKKHLEAYGNSPVADYIKTSRKTVESIKEFFEKTGKCADEIFITLSDRAKRDELFEQMSPDREIQLCCLEERFLEVTKNGTDKGTAFDYLREMLGIDKNATAAFGDNDNDSLFLKSAAVSVVMGNAADKLKKCADIIAPSNEDDGVAFILNKM